MLHNAWSRVVDEKTASGAIAFEALGAEQTCVTFQMTYSADARGRLLNGNEIGIRVAGNLTRFKQFFEGL